MGYDVQPVTFPTDLLHPHQDNGSVADSLRVSISGIPAQATMHHIAAQAFVAMRNAAKAEANVDLRPSSAGDLYRDYGSQESLFRSRYQLTPIDGADTKSWRNEVWYKKDPGTFEAAAPGNSNHGWGLAIDLAGLAATPVNDVSKWVLDNYARFGFSHEHHDKSDPVHIRYYRGDDVPDDVTGVVNTERMRQHHFMEEDNEMLPIVTNAEQFGKFGPKVMKWVVMDDGTLRHLGEQEWMVRGSLDGTAWTNVQLAIAGINA